MRKYHRKAAQSLANRCKALRVPLLSHTTKARIMMLSLKNISTLIIQVRVYNFMNKADESKKRNINIDIAKAVSCFMVILLHVTAVRFYQFSDQWLIINILNSFTRVSVPIFIMVTGYLIVNSKNTTFSEIPRRCKRVVICLIAWSFFYIIADSISYGDVKNINILKSITSVINGPIKYHLWYLYSLIGFYIASPILSILLSYSSKNTIITVLSIWFVVSGFYTIKTYYGIWYVDLLWTYNLSIFSNMTGYLLLGSFISTIKASRKTISLSLYLYVIMSLFTAFMTYRYSSELGKPNELFYSYLSPQTIIGSACLFYYIVNAKFSKRFSSICAFISSISLGIYCVHIFFLEKISSIIGGSVYSIKLLTFTLFMTTILSVVVSFILKKLPLTSKIV
ncbi:acyltransferase family protein [Escherichia coli]|nr:acyltransferase family protein [Escherichia coli]EKC9888942.1 acyltransferase family protein [Escherichia coli]EKH7501664.1 acyltransferase family protein [Escherichia coli]EKH7537273.1 acyltransferase family protein [Escherichia coli]